MDSNGLSTINNYDLEIKKAAVSALPLDQDEPRKLLLELLVDQNTVLPVKVAIISRFCREVTLTSNVEPMLIKILQDKTFDNNIRVVVAKQPTFHYTSNMDLMLKLANSRQEILVDPKEKTIMKKASALGLGWDGQMQLEIGVLKNPDVDSLLLMEYNKTHNNAYRRALLESMVRRQVEDSIPLLTSIIESQEKIAWRKRCCVFLYWIGTKRALDVLIHYAQNSEEELSIRIESISVLPPIIYFNMPSMRDPENRKLIVSTLEDILRDPSNHRDLRNKAFEAISGLVNEDQLLKLEKELQ